MNNQPLYSNNIPTTPPTAPIITPQGPTKKPTKKIIIAVAVLLIVITIVVVGIIIYRNSSSDTFSDDPKKSLSSTSSSTYLSLENYDEIDFDTLSDDQEQELQKLITTFFSYAFQNFKSLTASDINKKEVSKENEATEEENIETVKTISFNLTSDTKERFTVYVEVSSNVYGYNLSIENHKNEEIYSQFKNTDFNTIKPYKNKSDFLEAISYKLPYSSETKNGVKFDVAYEDDEQSRLTISAADEEAILSEADCTDAKEKTLEWVKNLSLEYDETISTSNFICSSEKQLNKNVYY